ncbi:enoyl-CoA hydratase/isomerase family protein [Zavarzinia compransoris]|uniref:enoyl-CoA hydratase/isomerase family protein n=1 Tax=Zavarzinia marina TaxID=2911065 RepID=UPI001F260446|nr:enoyl-CoA hydratase/isomerase family protein [Zavarzinia marina]MCF4164250.1 enoyl-CoA hydratase/isomerase family protein [Zavarzinia marina]
MAQVSVRIEDSVAIITLDNSPDGLIDALVVTDLARALDTVEAAPRARAVVVTGGTEGVFAGPYSVPELEHMGRHLRVASVAPGDDPLPAITAFAHQLARIEGSPLPFIAAVNGTCIGAGFDIALACDIRIVEDGDYTIGFPEANIGLVPLGGGARHLARLVGPAKALELMLMGRTVSPIEAMQLGIAQEMAPDLALDAALIMAHRLADQSRDASARLKRLIRGDGPAAPDMLAHLIAGDEAIARMRDVNQGERDIED